MSLEQAINDHAAAIRELAAAFSKLGQAGAVATAQVVEATPVLEVVKTPTTAKEATAQALAAAKKAADEKKAAAAEPAPAEDDLVEAKVFNYDKDVAPALTQYLKTKGREAGVALLAKYGAKNGQGVKEADYAAIMADMAG